MRYDKQTKSITIPLEDIESCERDGSPVDMQNAWMCHLPGALVITLKSKGTKEPNEQHSGPHRIGRTKKR